MPPEFLGQAQHFLRDRARPAAGVGVIGDLGLDHFVFGSVDRISPEAPVPVLLIERREEELACAANVVRSLAVFVAGHKDFRIEVFGAIGNDELGAKLLKKFAELPSPVGLNVHQVDGRPTTLKTRFIAGSQHQLLRVDNEDTRALGLTIEKNILQSIEAKAAGLKFLILQDYAKGLFSESFAQTVIELAAVHKIKTLVDPHRNTPPQYFKNAWLMKPNVAEAEILLGRDLKKGEDDALISEAAKDIKSRFGIASVLITRSRYGSTLVDEAGLVQHFPAIARAVYDVTGAGDTYLAVLAASLAGEAELPVACVLANAAASVVVGKVGTASATVAEMLAELQG